MKQKLQLLLAKNSLDWKIFKGKTCVDQKITQKLQTETEENTLEILQNVLVDKVYDEIEIISSINQFSILPSDFNNHQAALDLISLNAEISEELDEIMLSVNKKMEVQFYFAIPKIWYQLIKKQTQPSTFDFSGADFLKKIQPKSKDEIYINLYLQQCEFFIFKNNKILLYNNLDIKSEVDFLYFILFSLSKMNFNLISTVFYIYGETSENETFITELQKFSSNVNVMTNHSTPIKH